MVQLIIGAEGQDLVDDNIEERNIELNNFICVPGLQLLLFINLDENIPDLTPNPGIRLIVHRQDQEPMASDNGVNIGTGMKTAIKVRLVSVAV